MVGFNGSALPSFEIEQEYHSSPFTAKADRQNDDPNPAHRYAPSSPRRARSSQTSRGPKPLLPRSLKEALQLAELLSKSKLIPKGFETPETCLVGILYGMEVGLSPIAALQRMAVIDGRPTIWGDAALALVQASGLLQSIEEEIFEKQETDHRKILTAICKVKREGRSEPVIGTFSIEDAKRAGLWEKPGPWTDYPKRMLTMRARAFALRDAFPDVLAGLYIREEFEGSQARCEQPRSASGSRPKSKDRTHDDRERANEADQKQRTTSQDDTTDAGATRELMKADKSQRTKNSSFIRKAPPPPPLPAIKIDGHQSSAHQGDSPTTQEMTSDNHNHAVSDWELASITQEPGSEHLDPETLLDLFDSALCCALDLPTLEEIVDEFAERLRPLPREIQDRAQGIIERHQKRVDELDQSSGSVGGGIQNQELTEDRLVTEPLRNNNEDAEDRKEAGAYLPRGLRALLPSLGLGSAQRLQRRQNNKGRQARSLASWNARQRLQALEFKNTNLAELEYRDDQEGEL